MTEQSSGELLPSVVSVVRAATSLAAQDVDFYRSLSKGVAKSLDKVSEELMSMINNVSSCIDQGSVPLEGGREKLEDSYKDFGYLMDNLFEKSDRSLDVLKGRTYDRKGTGLMFLDDAARNDIVPVKRIVKPQLNFKRPVDNTETHPFKPLLKKKPHSLRPLSDCVKLIRAEESVPEHYPQPYEYEIENQEYNEGILMTTEPIPPKPWDETEPIWVDNKDSLESMLQELKNSTEIAVDLEHHDYRSYYGIVCLMQISTRQCDYLIDTLALRDDLGILNEVFTDPLITKVFHGAFMDIIWLQRDLGLYIVSLFDTYHASRALAFPRHSLAYLLETLACFKTSKKYQLADWRVRPLSKTMAAYARADTHFLLNIYDQLRNKLVMGNKLAGVLAESRKVAKRSFQYSKYGPRIPNSSVYSPIDRADGWNILMNQYNIPREKEILVKNLYEWRDTIARRDDESSRYVMPNQLLAYLVDYTPVDYTGVMSVSPTITDHVRNNAKFLANLIARTLEQTGNLGRTRTKSVQLSPSNDQYGLCQLLTVSQIESQVCQFRNFSKVLNDVTKSAVSVSCSSSLIFGDILSEPSGFIGYTHGLGKLVSNNQIEKRRQELLQLLKSRDESIGEFREQDRNLEFVQENSDIEQTGTDYGINDREDEKSEPKEDRNEIVTLKKIRKKGQEPSKKSNELEREKPVDYKSRKIMETEEKSKSKNKRSFDPNIADHDAENVPKPKKKRRMIKGRGASFKR